MLDRIRNWNGRTKIANNFMAIFLGGLKDNIKKDLEIWVEEGGWNWLRIVSNSKLFGKY
jgi:hypothetical protein